MLIFINLLSFQNDYIKHDLYKMFDLQKIEKNNFANNRSKEVVSKGKHALK